MHQKAKHSAALQSTPPLHVLIAAAGASLRFGSNTPKCYVKLSAVSVLRRAVMPFLNLPGLASLRVIISPEHIKPYHEAVTGLEIDPPVIGSKTRKESIYNGLLAINNISDEDIVLVHDAARPLIQQSDILRLLEALQTHQAAALASPIVDTLMHEDGTSINRRGVYALQTPQGFRLSQLKQAHGAAIHDFTDDTSLLKAVLGIDTHLLPATAPNFKITTQEDLHMAEKLLSTHEPRIGTGFDVHAFGSDNTRSLMLGGIEIPHDKSLKGHSDADVVLHALTDALLGAIADGDIGVHFPPSNPQYKDANSEIFLSFARDRIAQRGFIIQNVDVTVICEAPKIAPRATAMRQNIARILQIDIDRIGIKATTTEQLGFTGRGEGIAAQAIACIKLPS